MEVLFLILLCGIMIALIVSKSRKRKKERDLKEKFKVDLKNHIAGFAYRDEYFLGLYNEIMKVHNVDSKMLDALLLSIPEHKEKLSAVCSDLLSLSNNICLFSQDKLTEWESKDLLTTERITHDIIEVLPCLGRFYKEYNLLYKTIYEEILTEKFTLKINQTAFGWFFEEKSDSTTDLEKYKEAMANMIDDFLNVEIEKCIRSTLKLNRGVEIMNSTNPTVKSLLDIANDLKNNGGLFHKFLKIWVEKMRNIGRKYGELQLELHYYFDDLNKKMKKQMKWFSIHYFVLRFSGLRLEKETEEECLRVLNLYTSGQMEGTYSKPKENIFLKKIN